MSDTVTTSSTDLSSTWSQVLADLEAEQTQSVASSDPTPSDTPQEVTEPVEPTETPETPEPQATPQSQEPAPQTLYEVKADGKTEQITLEELQRRASAGTHFTRKQMALAERERQIEAWAQQKERETNDPNWLAQQYARLVQAQTQQVQQENAQAPAAQQLTPEQVAHIAEQRVQEVIFQRDLTHFHDTAQREIAHATTEVITSFPKLKDIDDIDFLLRRDAGKLVERDRLEGKTTSIDEVKSYLKAAAKARAEKIDKRDTDREQAAIMRHEKAKKPSIAPPSGAIPAVQAPQKLRWGTGDYAKSIEADLRAEQAR